MANVLFFKLIAITIIALGIRAHLTEGQCDHDHNCKSHEFCNVRLRRCQSCVDCGKYNRQFADVKCPKTSHECGSCFNGYYTVHDDHTDILCQKGRKLFTRTLSSTNETDLGEDEDETVPVWVYVLCVTAGLLSGFAVGGIAGILAYKLYFLKRSHRERKDPVEKCHELHEMQPETRKYSTDSIERGEIAYGLIVNNTKNFPAAKNSDAKHDQELIPLQGNAAPVLSNNLYYVDDANKVI